jgi:protease-4
MTKLEDLRDAVAGFKTSGKTVLATADDYSQTAYYLAAQADEIYLHEMGLVVLPGFGRYVTHFKDGLDRLGVDVHVFRVGEYKSAVEPFLRNDMSDEAKEANLDWLGDLWRAWIADVAAARGLSEERLLDYVHRFPELLRQQAGDAARAALEAGLVDHVGERDMVRDRLVELVGEDETTHSFQGVSYQDYLAHLGSDRASLGGGSGDDDQVAVLVARGDILDGRRPPGEIGGDSTAALVRQARDDDTVKALVLRVDSGGGSAFASEVIRRELELLREAGKPVVISMGTVAASGGYWIATASDEIWASPTTITGSIGIFGIFPTFQKPLARYLGMHVDGVGTTPLAGALRPDRELSAEAAEAIQQITDRGYQEFLDRVAEARGMTPEEVDRIARGRVWSGEDAHAKGLVDHLGGLDQAIAAAAQRAGLEGGYGITWLEQELDFEEQLAADLLSRATEVFGLEGRARMPAAAALGAVEPLLRSAGSLDGVTRAALADPRGLVAHCLCEVE